MSPARPDHKIVDRTKIRDGQVANRPIYVALAVTVEGRARHPRAVGRRRRRGRQVLAARADRDQEPRRGRRADGRLRRPQGPAATRSRPSGRSPSPRPAWCTCCATASATPAASTGTPSPRPCARSTPRRPRRRRWSGSLSSPRPGAAYPAIVRLWENAWAEFVPFLSFDAEIRRIDLHDQRDRVRQRPDPPGGQGPRPLPQRASRAEMRLHGDHEPGPDRHGPQAAGSCAGSPP